MAIKHPYYEVYFRIGKANPYSHNKTAFQTLKFEYTGELQAFLHEVVLAKNPLDIKIRRVEA